MYLHGITFRFWHSGGTLHWSTATSLGLVATTVPGLDQQCGVVVMEPRGPLPHIFNHLDLYRKDRHPSVEMAKFHTLHSVVKQSTQRGPTEPVGRTGLLLRAPSLTPRLIRTSGQDSLGIHTSSKYISRRIYNIDMIQIAGRML